MSSARAGRGYCEQATVEIYGGQIAFLMRNSGGLEQLHSECMQEETPFSHQQINFKNI